MKLRHLLKVFTAIFLCSAMLFSLCACMGESESETEKHEEKEEKKEKAVTVIETDNFSVTKSQMSYYFYSLYQSTCNSLASYGIDPSVYGLKSGVSLKTQKCSFDQTKTWFEYFMESATKSVEEQLALCEAAKAAGIKLTDKDYKEIESVIDSLEETAKAQGYSLKNYIKANYGTIVSVGDVEKSLEIEMLATKYLESELKKVDVSDAAIKAEYDANKDEYDTVDYLTFTFDIGEIRKALSDEDDSISNSELEAEAEAIAEEYTDKLAGTTDLETFEEVIKEYYVNVFKMTESEVADKLAGNTTTDALISVLDKDNHVVEGAHYSAADRILMWMFKEDVKEGDSKIFTETKSSYETYTVVVVTRPRGVVTGISEVDVRHILFSDEAKAEKIYEQWKRDGSKVEDFVYLALEYSEDTGSKFDGGLYEGVTEGQMITEFNDWIFDEGRIPGDHGIVKTSYGWHIMYFVDGYEEWESAIKADLQNEASANAVEAARGKYNVIIDYDAVNDIDA